MVEAEEYRESLFLVFSSIEGRREEGEGRNWVVEMQSYTLPPVGTTRYYCWARVLHDVQLACHP